MKRRDKIKNVIRSKLQSDDRTFSFVVERRKHLKLKAENFANALNKALSLNPKKRVRYNLKFYLMAEQEGMDLMSAKVEAAKKSKELGKRIYIFMDNEGDHYLSESLVKGTIACYQGGSELVEERPTAPVTPAGKSEVKKSVAPSKNVAVQASNVDKEKAAPKKTAKQIINKTKKTMATAKKASAKKSASKKVTPAKKAAPAEKKVASSVVGKATTLLLTPAQWAKLEKLGSIRESATAAVIAHHKL